MSNKYFYSLIALAFILLTATTSLAVTISVNDNISSSIYIGSGRGIWGYFNINTVVGNDNNYVKPYDITSAFATFTFEDDLNDLRYGGYNTTSYYYNYSWYTGYGYISEYYRYNTTYYYDEDERSFAYMNGQFSTDGTDWYDMYSYNGSQYDGSNGYYPYYGSRYYTYNYIEQYGYRGQMSITQYLNASSLNDLSSDGIVYFDAGSYYGDLIYTDGKLTADINANPVPEPTTVVSLGAGLAMLITCSARRRNKVVNSN